MVFAVLSRNEIVAILEYLPLSWVPSYSHVSLPMTISGFTSDSNNQNEVRFALKVCGEHPESVLFSLECGVATGLVLNVGDDVRREGLKEPSFELKLCDERDSLLVLSSSLGRL